jgi:hypothetical protein
MVVSIQFASSHSVGGVVIQSMCEQELAEDTAVRTWCRTWCSIHSPVVGRSSKLGSLNPPYQLLLAVEESELPTRQMPVGTRLVAVEIPHRSRLLVADEVFEVGGHGPL